MDWERLKKTPCWTSIHDMPFKWSSVDEDLYKIADTCFLIAMPHDRDCTPSSRPPHVTTVMWADSDGAARRALRGRIEADNERLGLTPPAALLLAPGVLTYGDIVAVFASRRHGDFEERAEYRIATDGAFIHRVISARLLSFFFRSRKHDNDEAPYAIQYVLQ